MKLTCRHCGDYLLPDLGLNECDKQPIGKCGMLRMNWFRGRYIFSYSKKDTVVGSPIIPQQAVFVGKLTHQLHTLFLDIGGEITALNAGIHSVDHIRHVTSIISTGR